VAQNELLGGEGVNLILSKRFQIQGAAAPFMASEMFPNITLENDRPEWGFLAGTRIAGSTATLGGTAAENSQVGVRNPAGSNVIIVVTRASLGNAHSAAAALQLRIGLSPTVDADTLPAPRDTRWGSLNANTVGLVFVRSGALLGRPLMQFTSNATFNLHDLQGPWVLGPGGFLLGAQVTVNRAMNASYEWYERAAKPGELQAAKAT